jgi:hypothetical protein
VVADPLADLEVDSSWDRDPATHPDWAPWRRLAAEWTPETPLGRIEAKAGFVFGNVALVGTLAAGLGLVTGVRIPDALRPLSVATGGLVVLALALALAAAMPSWRTSTPLRLEALKRLYERRIAMRGWLVRFSMLAYAAAFFAAVAIVVLAVTATAEPSLGLRAMAKGDAKVVTGTVNAQGLAADALASTTLVAILADGTTQTLATDISKPGAAGALTVTLTVDPAPAAPTYRLQTQIHDASGDLLRQFLDLPG